METEWMPLAELIWRTSRADESTISATGANIVARAIVASDWFRGAQADAWHEGHLNGVHMQHLIETGKDSWPEELGECPYGIPPSLLRHQAE